jgi:hypothetical protein
MGKIFLLLIGVGFVWGGWRLYGVISEVTQPVAPTARIQSAESARESVRKEPEPVQIEAAPGAEPLPVVASTAEWIQVEGWGMVMRGQTLPDGVILRAWSAEEALVSDSAGRHQRVRFRRFGEALRDLARSAGVAMASPSTE